MKVIDLIEILKKYDENVEVKTCCDCGCYESKDLFIQEFPEHIQIVDEYPLRPIHAIKIYSK